MTDYIPFAIQGEIMKRLPTKSLLRFRSVSKPWKSLIDSSEFIADYSFTHTHQQHLLVSYLELEKNEQKYVSFVDDDTFPHEKYPLRFRLHDFSMPTILGTSQGVFCVYKTVNGNPNAKMVFFWNPSIRKTIGIFVSDVIDHDSLTDIGFGVCPRSKDLKLVKIKVKIQSKINHSLLNKEDVSFTPWQVEVYTLSSRAWKSIPTNTINLSNEPVILKGNQVDIDGIIYWLGMNGVSIRLENETVDIEGYNLIVTFDVTRENFMEVSLPDTLARANSGDVTISKLKESLVVVEVVKEGDKQVYDVWMMERGVSNMFTKLFTISLPDAAIQGILGFRKNGEPIFEMSSTNDSDEEDLLVHEVNSEDMNYVGISRNGFPFYALTYMETLLLL